jgi:hypothetical protein
MMASITDGLRSAAKQPKLLLLIWAWYGLLALVPALPAWAWWNAVLGSSPEGSTVLRHFSFGVWGEMVRAEGVSGLGLLMVVTAVLLVVAWLSSAFVFGGILDVLGSDGDQRPFMHRFYRGGGRFFWRFIRLSLAGAVCALLAAGLVSGLVFGLLGRAPDPEWEAGGYLIGLGNALLVALVSSLFLLALDYARIRVARDGSRGMLRAYAGGLGFVVSNLGMTYGVAIPLVLLLVALVLGYVGYEANAPAAGTWGAIAALLLVQQVTVLGRVFLRIALVGAERGVDVARRQAPLQAPAAGPAVVAAEPAVPVSEAAAPTGVTPEHPENAPADRS